MMSERTNGAVDALAPSDSIVVVGASHSGVHLADRLRSLGFTGSITLISAEPHLPYQRPPLSKAWLKGEASAQSLLLREAGHYQDAQLELLTDTTVDTIAREGSGVRLTMSVDGAPVIRDFDRLVLATGARARRLPLPGSDHRNVLALRDMDHAIALADRVSAGPFVIIGGGFIGLEVAATLRALGAEVTVIEVGSQLMGRAVGAFTAGELEAVHRGADLNILLGARPTEICTAPTSTGDSEITGVSLADGSVIPAATVLVGVGAEPRTELAAQLGLEIEGGIVVDEACRTSDEAILAIGDCTVQVHPTGRRVRLESVDNAVEQANAAAATLMGTELPVRPAPWFWSDQGDSKLQIVGRIDGFTSMVVRTDEARPRRKVALYFVGEELVAAECLNSPADFVAVRTALAKGLRPTAQSLADTAIPLRKLLNGIPV